MGDLFIKSYRTQAIPDCCGNCKHNDWQEDGPHCRNPVNWMKDEYEMEEGLATEIDDDNSQVDWYGYCDGHLRGPT